MTPRKSIITIGVNASLRTVQRALGNHDHMEYGHLQERPKLETRHVKLRLEWTTKFNCREPKNGVELSLLMRIGSVSMFLMVYPTIDTAKSYLKSNFPSVLIVEV